MLAAAMELIKPAIEEKSRRKKRPLIDSSTMGERIDRARAHSTSTESFSAHNYSCKLTSFLCFSSKLHYTGHEPFIFVHSFIRNARKKFKLAAVCVSERRCRRWCYLVFSLILCAYNLIFIF